MTLTTRRQLIGRLCDRKFPRSSGTDGALGRVITRLPMAASVAAIVTALSLLLSCSTSSVGPGDPQVSPDPTAFALPRRIVVMVAPYNSVDEALQQEPTIDWLRDKSAAQAITLAYAATELRDHLALAGVAVSLSVSDSDPTDSAIVLSVRDPKGAHSSAGPDGSLIPYGALGDQGYAITPWRRRIYITAADRIGVLNGIYGLLDQLGFAWYDPYDIHTPSPSALAGSISWRTVREVPRVKLRGFWIYGDARIPDEFAVWLARNRLNVGGRARPSLHHKLGLKGWGGGHDLLQQEFSRPGLFAEHPEWFALVSGVRRPISADSGTYFNPNLSSPDAAGFFADRMISRLESGDLKEVDILNVWPSDDRFNSFDQSAEALAIGNETDNLLNFYANVGATFRAAYADGRLSRPVALAGISYFLTMRPPTNRAVITELERNEYLHLFYLIERSWSGRMDIDLADRDANRTIIQDLSAWQSAAAFNYGIVEYHNLSTYAGLGLSDFPYFAENFQFLTRNRSALYAYMHPLLKNPGPRRLTNRLLSRLAWVDTDADTAAGILPDAGETLIQEYFDRRYGAHAAGWRTIHELMSQSVENAKEVFGTNSLYWLLFQEFFWASPPYTLAQTAEFIPRFRAGGVQDLPGAFSDVKSVRATFRGLDESIRLQEQAAQLWTAMLDSPLPAAERRRMESDVAWFVATASRYRLMAATSDYVVAKQNQLDLSEPRSRIVREVAFLRESPVLADTISPVDQRSFLDLHLNLAQLR